MVAGNFWYVCRHPTVIPSRLHLLRSPRINLGSARSIVSFFFFLLFKEEDNEKEGFKSELRTLLGILFRSTPLKMNLDVKSNQGGEFLRICLKLLL